MSRISTRAARSLRAGVEAHREVVRMRGQLAQGESFLTWLSNAAAVSASIQGDPLAKRAFRERRERWWKQQLEETERKIEERIRETRERVND